ncbi:MAG: heavy-metal-associated domain-containing protein, partial [Desulfuromonadales bacterium]|nr:heavy-metal-associated domain-containing protein [Desulfuromonadales bacterium]
MTEETLNISGMSCTNCARNLEQGLLKRDGVSVANVNFAVAKLKVVYDDTQISSADLFVAIEALGFGASKDSDALETGG